jgi:[acyl-carrier-protein] S-malonyltransferase
MGRALAEAYPAARVVFEEVDQALGAKLSAVIWDGPEDRLVLTENAQPALMAVSMAVIRALEAEGIAVPRAAAYVAGHSLGEYSALAAAGSLGVADAARLLRIRGRAMQQAVPVGEGAMAALLGLDLEASREVADEAAAAGGVCQVANDNAPGQVVVSGSRAAVERAMELAREKGAMKAVSLPVSAPFHCALMAPAAEAMQAALEEVTISPPAVPLVANVVAAPISEPDEIRRRLIEQVTGTVRWREGVLRMAADGVTMLYEIGAGRVLTGLAKRIDRALKATTVGTPDDLAALIAAQGGD